MVWEKWGQGGGLHHLAQVLIELDEAALVELAGVHHLVHLAGKHGCAPELAIAQRQAEPLRVALCLGHQLGACTQTWHVLNAGVVHPGIVTTSEV